ncbi:hypothetical protein [Bacillus sp. FJAT-28004]|uniref:hypothetical protein n=1 Tax=Bacillus sp. FJAT-28004 TaxID=1679165 RepID=UPI0006B427BC|nr:hypothetical protein [Bacillus sp. FJAT-28004]
MKIKTIAICSVVILIIVIGTGYLAYEKYGTYYAAWENKWGITISKPDEIKVVFESQPSFNGDGEGYFILAYTEKQMKKMEKEQFWQPINEEYVNVIDGLVSRFKESVIEIYPDQKEKYEGLYRDHPTEYGVDDLYFYKKKDDGSYVITVFNLEKKRMHIMEWTQ